MHLLMQDPQWLCVALGFIYNANGSMVHGVRNAYLLTKLPDLGGDLESSRDARRTCSKVAPRVPKEFSASIISHDGDQTQNLNISKHL